MANKKRYRLEEHPTPEPDQKVLAWLILVERNLNDFRQSEVAEAIGRTTKQYRVYEYGTYVKVPGFEVLDLIAEHLGMRPNTMQGAVQSDRLRDSMTPELQRERSESLRVARSEAGYSQSRMARKLRVNDSLYGAWELGVPVPQAFLMEALEIDPDADAEEVAQRLARHGQAATPRADGGRRGAARRRDDR